jgi:hypothetical protein
MDVQWPEPRRAARWSRLVGVPLPVVFAAGAVMAASISPASAAPKSNLCSLENSYVIANFAIDLAHAEIAKNNPTTCEIGNVPGKAPTVGYALELAYGADMPGSFISSTLVLSAQSVWQAAHTPGGHEQAWIVASLGRLAPDGSSALGDIAGHGKVTAIIWRTGIAKAASGQPADLGYDIEIADGYSVVYAGNSEWPYPVGSAGVNSYPPAHENALKSLATRLLPLFYDKTRPTKFPV